MHFAWCTHMNMHYALSGYTIRHQANSSLRVQTALQVLLFLALMWHLTIQSSQPCQDINFWPEKRGVVRFCGVQFWKLNKKCNFRNLFSPHYSAWYQLFASLGEALKSEEEKHEKNIYQIITKNQNHSHQNLLAFKLDIIENLQNSKTLFIVYFHLFILPAYAGIGIQKESIIICHNL